MGMENKANFIIAVNGYKIIKKEKNANFTDVTALDYLDKKVLLRIIEPLSNECIVFNDVKNMEELIKRDSYDFAFLISKKFTDSAIDELVKQSIRHASDDYMPPFDIEKLYLAIVDYANNQCQRKCGKTPVGEPDCSEKKVASFCKTRALADDAKRHFEQGLVGLLKNDLMVALALNR